MWKDSARCGQTTAGQTDAGCLQRKLSKPQDHSSEQHPSTVSASVPPLSSCCECLPWYFLHGGLWAIRCHKSFLLQAAFGHDVETLLGQRKTHQNMATLQVPGYRGAVFSHMLGAASKVLRDSWLRRHQGIHLSVGSWLSPGVFLFHLHIKSTKVPLMRFSQGVCRQDQSLKLTAIPMTQDTQKKVNPISPHRTHSLLAALTHKLSVHQIQETRRWKKKSMIGHSRKVWFNPECSQHQKTEETWKSKRSAKFANLQ